MARRGRPARSRIVYVAQWGPEAQRGALVDPVASFRSVQVDSLEEGRAVALAGAAALSPEAPWLAGATVSKVLMGGEAEVSFVHCRWLLRAPTASAPDAPPGAGWVEI